MLDRLFERRAISGSSLFGTNTDSWGSSSWSGSKVTYDSAFMLSTTYAAVRLVSDAVSTFPADTFFRTDGERKVFRPRPAWVTEPDLGMTMSDHMQQVVVSMMLAHGACVRKFRNDVGEVVALTVLDPTKVEPVRTPVGDLDFIWNGTVRIPAADMVYIPMLRKPGQIKGVSPLDELGQMFGAAAALDEFAARFFSGGSTTTGIIELPQTLTQVQAKEVKATFEDGHRGNRKSHRVAVLGGGAKFVKTGVDPDQAQMLESRRFMVEEVARVFRVPLHMLQVAAPGVQSYSSNEENAIQFATFTLRPIVKKIEDAYSALLPGGAFLKLNMDALLRGDLKSRYDAYSVAMQAGFMSVNMIQRLEDQPAVEGGDAFRVPLANIDLNASSLIETDKRVQMAQRLILAGFDPAETLSQLGLPPIAHTGLPSAQLQQVAQVAPDAPTDAYPVRSELRDVEPADDVSPLDVANILANAIRHMPTPVVNVAAPEVPAPVKRVRSVERDELGNIVRISEE